jgi:hypothetical protein
MVSSGKKSSACTTGAISKYKKWEIGVKLELRYVYLRACRHFLCLSQNYFIPFRKMRSDLSWSCVGGENNLISSKIWCALKKIYLLIAHPTISFE